MEAISRSCLPEAAARTKRQRKATCCGVLGAASHRTTCSRSSAAKLTSGLILAMRTHISYWPQYVYLFMIHTTSRASFKLWLLRFCRCRFRTCRRAATHFTNFETHEAPDGNAFAELGDRLSDHLADCHALVLDVVLFVEAILLVELLHFARDDFLDDLLRLAGSQRLRPIDFALLLEHVRGDFLAPHIARIERGDVHGDVVRKLLKCFRARHEVRLAVQLHDHADLSASVDVAAHQAFAGFARSFLGCSCLALLAQNADGFFDVAIGFDERGAAITEARVGPFPQFLDELGWNLHGRLLCTHSFFPCSLKSCCLHFLQNGPPRAVRGGPLEFPTHAVL